jgi:hypothetical protein
MSAPISYAITEVEAGMCAFGMTKPQVEEFICDAVAMFIADNEREGVIDSKTASAMLERSKLSRPRCCSGYP